MSITSTLGKSGRLIVPKVIRDSLGLHEGSRLKLEVQGGKLQAAPEPDPVNIGMKGGFPVKSPKTEVEPQISQIDTDSEDVVKTISSPVWCRFKFV